MNPALGRVIFTICIMGIIGSFISLIYGVSFVTRVVAVLLLAISVFVLVYVIVDIRKQVRREPFVKE